MKKLLVVLLAVAMIFCFAATAMATTYSDMNDQTDAGKDAVAFNSALDIVAGYPDGTFGPAKNITRAEFAKIAVNAVGLSDSADYMANTASKFADVKVGAWYTGYVNLAQAQGFIAGYPDGTFRPNATITNQEVITVLMRMLGYDDRLTGPWPVDYINKAVKLDILDDVKFVGATPATRVDVAIMVKATLEADIVSWDDDKDDFLKDTETFTFAGDEYTRNISLLVDSFGEGTVENDVTINGLYNSDADADKLFEGAAFTYDSGNDEFTLQADIGDYTMNADTVISDNLTFDKLAGQEADLVLKNAGESDEYVAYINVTSYTKNFDEVNAVTKVDGEVTKVKLDDTNYDVASYADVDNFPTAATDDCNLNFVAYFDDDDNVYAVVPDKKIVGADTECIVDSVSSTGKITTLAGDTPDKVSDADDVVIIKDGAKIAVTDIKQYDVVKQFKDDQNNYNGDSVYLVSALPTGSLDKVYTNYTTLAGVKYPNGDLTAFDSTGDEVDALSDYLGDTVSYLINANNQVIGIFCGAESSSTIVRGIVTDYDAADGAYAASGDLNSITIMQADGKTATYKVDDDQYQLYNADDTNTVAVATAAANDISIGSYVQFTVDSDGTINDAKTPEKTEADAAPSYTYDDDYNRITIDGTKYTLASDAVIFNLSENDDEELDVDVQTRDEFVDGDSIDVAGIDLDKADPAFAPTDTLVAVFTDADSTTIKYLVAMDGNSSSDIKYGIVDQHDFLNSDGDYVVTFYGDDKEYVLDSYSVTVGGVTTDYSNADVNEFIGDDQFYAYTVSGDKVTLLDTSDLDNIDETAPITADDEYLDFATAVPVEVTSVDDDLVTFENDDQGNLIDSTVVLDVTLNDDKSVDDVDIADINDVDEGDNVYYVINDDDEIEFVIIVE